MLANPSSLFAALVAGALITAAANAAPHEPAPVPETARIGAAAAAVRSGPGIAHYLTDTLPEGTTVEVYRRQPDGWCAIRPPADSFSWVFAQHLRLVGDGLAETVTDDVASRVGSHLSSQRNVVHVRLNKGETVELLGKDQRDAGLWYKIAPPAGEFRWIHSQDLAPTGRDHGWLSESSAVQTASHETAGEESAANASTEVAAPPLATNAAAPTPKPANDSTAPADITPIAREPLSSAELAQQLEDLELRISRMVAEPVTTWNVAALEQTGERLLTSAETVTDRAAVKRTLTKIDRFAAVQRRFATMSANLAMGSAAATPPAVVNQQQPALGAGAGNTVAGQFARQYDAAGILRPVVSRRPGAPQFALVNDQGQVVTFLTPTPDVNLQPYVGRRIAVTGNRGYIPEFRRAHVTAGRVIPLEGRIIR